MVETRESLLLEQNADFVKRVVKKFRPKNITEQEELEQAGLIGLMYAIRKFDPNKNAKLTTFAFYYITSQICLFLKKERSPYQVGRTVDFLCYYPKFELSEYFDALTDNERRIIDMRLQGYSFTEIGKVLGKNRWWVSNAYLAVIKRIREKV
jgi:DNA-directed RNA polymerase specialized sigma subunit